MNEHRSHTHWSFSSLNQLLNICSLQWYFDRIAKVEKAFTPLPLSFGNAFHRTLEWFSLCRKEGEVPAASVTSDLFADLWSRQTEEDSNIQYPEDADCNTVCAQGRDAVACYVNAVDPGEKVVTVNESFALPVPTSEKPLVGELDLVVEKGGAKLVADQKTSARRWPKDQAHKSMQATCYGFAFRRHYPKDVPVVRFDVVVKNKTPVFEQHTTLRGADDEQRLFALIGKADQILAHELFYPADQGMYCASCPFQGPCKAWHKDMARTTVGIGRAA